jgi:hypothetical protein
MQQQSAGSEPLTNVLKQRHQFDEWRGVNRLSENLFIWRFFLADGELEGWQPERIRTIETAETPTLTRSIWRGPEPEQLLALEVYECPSRATAHEHLIILLTQFQSTGIGREQTGELGDIAFMTPERTVALFARANLAVLARNAGPTVVPVYEAAAGLDRLLVRRPRPGGAVVPRIDAFGPRRAREIRTGDRVPLELAATDPLQRRLWYALWSRLGEIQLDQDELTYRAGPAGTDQLSAYAINKNGDVASATASLDIQRA